VKKSTLSILDIFMERIQIVFVGDSGVGKTSIIQKFQSDQANATAPTTGLETKRATLCVDGVQTDLMIWDTAGQEKYRSLIPLSFHNASVVAIVFDLSRRSTFDELDQWRQSIEDSAPQNVVRILVANKSDIDSELVHESEIEAACLGLEALDSYRTSARTGAGITELFERMVRRDIPRDPTYLAGIREEDRAKVLEAPNGCEC
jgi:small GTP-binding protein